MSLSVSVSSGRLLTCLPWLLPLATNAGVIVGATLGSVFGFVFLLILCMWFVLRRRRDTEDDMANDIK